MATKKQASPVDVIPEPPTRLAGLDGLRAIAVTTVIVFHLIPGLLPGGYLGVDIFFVISGFIITTLLLREHAATGAIRLRSFWNRRARRLLPGLAIMVLVCCSAAFAVGGDVLVGLGRQLLGAATFSYNWLAIASDSNYFDSTTPELLRNLWSLAVEEQFYLAWPFIIIALLLIKRRHWMLGLILLISVASAAWMTALANAGADPTRLYYGTDTHAFGLALGAALGVVASRWSRRPLEWRRTTRTVLPFIGAPAILALAALSWLMAEDSWWVFRGGLALVALLTALAIAGAIAPDSWLGRWLDVRPVRWVGERSYGLYLWHWPVFVLVVAALPGWNPWWQGGLALAITVLAAALSYGLVESPVRRLGFRGAWRAAWTSGPRTAFASMLSLLAIVGLVGVTGLAVATAPASGTAQQEIERGQQAIDNQPTPAPSADTADPQAPTALPGGDQIVAIGDSVMLATADDMLVAFPGISVDATVSRQMASAPELIEALKASGGMRPILLLGLGTNGPIPAGTMEKVATAAGPRTEIIVVNTQAPRGWIPGVNDELARFAQSRRNVELANWHGAIQPRIDVLATDLIHAGGPIGGSIYVGAVRDALQRLAELPPLLNSNDYGLSPRPA